MWSCNYRRTTNKRDQWQPDESENKDDDDDDSDNPDEDEAYFHPSHVPNKPLPPTPRETQDRLDHEDELDAAARNVVELKIALGLIVAAFVAMFMVSLI